MLIFSSSGARRNANTVIIEHRQQYIKIKRTDGCIACKNVKKQDDENTFGRKFLVCWLNSKCILKDIHHTRKHACICLLYRYCRKLRPE